MAGKSVTMCRDDFFFGFLRPGFLFGIPKKSSFHAFFFVVVCVRKDLRTSPVGHGFCPNWTPNSSISIGISLENMIIEFQCSDQVLPSFLLSMPDSCGIIEVIGT